MNTDVSFFKDSGLAVACAIVRDSSGHVLLSMGSWLRQCSGAEEAEVEAMSRTLSLVADRLNGSGGTRNLFLAIHYKKKLMQEIDNKSSRKFTIQKRLRS